MSGGIMKKRYMIMGLITAGLLLSGCGGSGTGGAPGSGGSEDTNILIQHVGIVGNDATPSDIDVANHLCPPDFTELEPINARHREDATITIDATLVNIGFESFPASVEECTITYLKSDDDPAAPIIETWTIFPNCFIEDSDVNECLVNLIDVPRKDKFWDDIITGVFDPEVPTRYIAKYECSYMNNFREEGHFVVEYEIFLADFDTC
jgi:hypothetical protein